MNKNVKKRKEWAKRRIKIYNAQAQILYGDCDHYVCLKCTDKIN